MMKAATLQLETLTCPSCAAKIEGALKSLNGVDQGSINFDADTIALDDITQAITKMGYIVEKSVVK
jgi:copper chaperone